MRSFPVSWGEWLASIQNAYDLQEVIEARLQSGMVLTPEEEHLLRISRRMTARYDRNGRSKFRANKVGPSPMRK